MVPCYRREVYYRKCCYRTYPLISMALLHKTSACSLKEPSPASEALARSLNIPAVTMLQRYGVPKFHHMLQQMGFKTINRSAAHYGLSLILGGAEATLWDVTNAYAQMGRILSNSHSNDLPQEREVQILLGTEEKTVSERDGSRKVTSGKDHFKKNNFEKGYIRRSYFRGSHFGRSSLAHPFRLNRSQPP